MIEISKLVYIHFRVSLIDVDVQYQGPKDRYDKGCNADNQAHNMNS